jgi:hypothetical protein
MGVESETHYAKSGDVHVAYQVMGTGPLDLVVVPGFISHLDLIRHPEEIRRAVISFATEPRGGLIVLPSPMTSVHRHQIVMLADEHRLPAIYPYRYFTAIGGLLSYGVDLVDQHQRAASYVDRILKGQQPEAICQYRSRPSLNW